MREERGTKVKVKKSLTCQKKDQQKAGPASAFHHERAWQQSKGLH